MCSDLKLCVVNLKGIEPSNLMEANKMMGADTKETAIHADEDISILKFGGNIVEIEKVKTIVITDEVTPVRPVG